MNERNIVWGREGQPLQPSTEKLVAGRLPGLRIGYRPRLLSGSDAAGLANADDSGVYAPHHPDDTGDRLACGSGKCANRGRVEAFFNASAVKFPKIPP